MDGEPELIHNDPDSEAAFEAMTDVIAEELLVRVAMGDQIITAEDAKSHAQLAADALLDRFIVRERATDQPRHSWRRP